MGTGRCRGWYRVGLQVHAGRAKSLGIFDSWSVAFHGVKSLPVRA
jgi:hypothetical protein